MTTRTDQPSKVATEDKPRAPDEHVVTSDLDFIQSGSSEDASSTAAATKPGGTNESDPAPDDTPAKPKRDRSAERRIARLAKKIADHEATSNADKARIAELESELESVKAATPKPKEPKFADFSSPQEYAKAYAKWEGSETATPAKRKPRENQPPPAMLADEGPSEDDILEFKRRGKEQLGDAFDAAQDTEGTAVNGVMASFLTDSEYGPEIYVYLAANQAESVKIFKQGAKGEAAMAKLEAKAEAGELGSSKTIENESSGDDGKDDGATGRKTKAPEPPSDTKPRGSVKNAVDPESESMDDYAERRKKEEARKRGVMI